LELRGKKEAKKKLTQGQGRVNGKQAFQTSRALIPCHYKKHVRGKPIIPLSPPLENGELLDKSSGRYAPSE
jgi:hypothetical protein